MKRPPSIGWWLTRLLGPLALGLWAVLVVVVALITIAIGSLGEVTSSVWSGARWLPQYFLLVLGVAVSAPSLRVFVAHGRTRRDVLVGGVVHGALMSLLVAVLMMVGFGLERFAFGLAGVEQFSGVDLLGSAGSTATLFAQFLVLYLAYFVAGWLICSGYVCFGGWIGTAILPVAILPALIAEAVSWRESITGSLVDGFDLIAGPGMLAVPFGLTLLSLVAIAAMLRRATIAPLTIR
ncbi:hypothetical protein [Stackebrandtia soli]|uniref:hypothetical protein n=1 Tax=Stackebrandtia soli TaxID=1892856 RepID=UPI0039EB230E